MTLLQVAANWPVLQRSTTDVQALVFSRLSECDKCIHKKQLSPEGFPVQGENRIDSVYYCGACGCPLWNKVKEEENKCPHNYWKPVESLY